MTTQSPSLMTFYKGWGGYQRNLVAIITPLTSAQLALPTASHHWTIGQLIQHMIADRVWWFHLWMGEGSPELAPITNWDPNAVGETPTIEPAELVAALEASWSMISNALERWTPSDLEYVFSPPATLSEAEQNNFGDTKRGWMIWHVLEHEIHHGGELSLALGGLGMRGIYGNA